MGATYDLRGPTAKFCAVCFWNSLLHRTCDREKLIQSASQDAALYDTEDSRQVQANTGPNNPRREGSIGQRPSYRCAGLLQMPDEGMSIGASAPPVPLAISRQLAVFPKTTEWRRMAAEESQRSSTVNCPTAASRQVQAFE